MGAPKELPETWLDAVGVSWAWVPFAVAWALTAWGPLVAWARFEAFEDDLLLLQIDPLLFDLPGSLLGAVVYLWPWIAVFRPQGTRALGVSRTLGVALGVAVALGLLALHPRDTWPGDGLGPCWDRSVVGRSPADQRWCEAQIARDLLTAAAFWGAGLLAAGLAFASARRVPPWLPAPFPVRRAPSARQDPHVLAALGLGLVSLLIPLGARVEVRAWPWATTLVWFAVSSAVVVYASWIAGQGLGREPGRSSALGLAWLAHLGPVALGVIYDAPQQPGELFFWAVVGAWLVGLIWQTSQLATPDPGYLAAEPPG